MENLFTCNEKDLAAEAKAAIQEVSIKFIINI